MDVVLEKEARAPNDPSPPCHRRRLVCAPVLPRACPRPFDGAATRAAAPSSGSPTSSCGFTRPRSRERCWSPGTRWTSRPIGTERLPTTRADANSIPNSSISLRSCRSSSPPAGSPTPRRPGYEADDFLAAAVAKEERRGTVLWSRPAIVTPISWRRPRRPSFSPSRRARWRGLARLRYAIAMVWNRIRSLTSSRCGATHRTRYRAPRAWDRRARRPSPQIRIAR